MPTPPASTPPRLIIFDDQRGRFGPLTRTRAAFAVRTGAHNNRVRIELALGIMATDLHVAPDLAAVYDQHETDCHVNQPVTRTDPITFHIKTGDPKWRPVTVPGDGPVLLVNGRWTGAAAPGARTIRQLPLGRALSEPDGSLLAAHVTAADAQAIITHDFAPPADAQRLERDTLLSRPWHILDQLEQTLGHDLSHWPESRPRVAYDAHVHDSAVLDDSAGPIVIDRHATVGPLAVIQGPCYVGERAHVRPQALLRPHTVVGPVAIAAGEISGAIIDAYSNKAHTGFLGNALVGQWVNLGADTNASNLKNTYGPIRVQLEPDAQPEDAGRDRMGPILGDYVRTAIGTRLTTGAVVDLGTMYAASPMTPKYLPPFRFITDGGDAPYAFDKFVNTAKIAMARRSVQLAPPMEAHLRHLFDRASRRA